MTNYYFARKKKWKQAIDRDNKFNDERRQGLGKIYKVVRLCRLCRKPYGSDKKEDSGICQICSI